MDESVDNTPLVINGPLIDLFDPALPVLQEKIVQPGQQAFLYDLKRMKDKKTPQVLCAASRVYEEKREAHTYAFVAKSPDNTNNVMRILLPAKPQTVVVKDANGTTIADASFNWDELSQTCLLQCKNAAAGVLVSIKW